MGRKEGGTEDGLVVSLWAKPFVQFIHEVGIFNSILQTRKWRIQANGKRQCLPLLLSLSSRTLQYANTHS